MTAKRERGEGSVKLRGRRWWIKYSHRGRTYEESSRSTDRRDAVRLLRKRLGEIQGGRHAPKADGVMFEDLATILEDDYKLQGHRSLRRVLYSLTHLRETFGTYRAVDIGSGELTAYVLARQAAGAADATVANELAALKRAFTLAVRAGRLRHRPSFPTLRLDNARTGFFEERDFRRLLAELPADLRPPMMFAYLTGWRLTSEVLTLTWPQVDLDAGAVRLEVGSTKNREGRTFPVNALPELAALLREQRAHTEAVQRRTGQIVPWVFHRQGQPIRDFRGAWRAACTRAGLADRIPHDFRRTAVRNLVRAGVPERVAMLLTGHKTRSIFDRYDIVNERDLAEGVAKLAVLRTRQVAGARIAEPGNVIPLARGVSG